MAQEDLLGDNRIEDVRWLCSLSESELDMLISLKKLVLQRAKIVGHEALAKKFDLKMLRVLVFILMEHLKGQLKDVSVIPGLVESSTFLDRCNLLNCNLNDSFGTMSIDELKAYVGPDQRKRIAEILANFLQSFLDQLVKKLTYGVIFLIAIGIKDIGNITRHRVISDFVGEPLLPSLSGRKPRVVCAAGVPASLGLWLSGSRRP